MGGARTCGSNWGDKPPPYPTAPTLHQLEWASVGRTPQHAAPPISSNKPRPRPSTHPCTYITGPDWLTGDQAGSSGWRRANQREGPQDRRHSLQWQVNIYIVKKRNEKPRRSRCGGLSLVVLVIESTQADTAAWVTLWCTARFNIRGLLAPFCVKSTCLHCACMGHHVRQIGNCVWLCVHVND